MFFIAFRTDRAAGFLAGTPSPLAFNPLPIVTPVEELTADRTGAGGDPVPSLQ